MPATPEGLIETEQTAGDVPRIMVKAAPTRPKLGSALARRLRAKKVLKLALKLQDIVHKEWCEATELLQFMRPHLSAMSSEAVVVVETIEAKVLGTKRQTQVAPTQTDTQLMEFEAILRAEMEVEAKQGSEVQFLEAKPHWRKH